MYLSPFSITFFTYIAPVLTMPRIGVVYSYIHILGYYVPLQA